MKGQLFLVRFQAALFVAVVVSGLVLRTGGAVHKALGVAFSALVLIHVAINRGRIMRSARGGRQRRRVVEGKAMMGISKRLVAIIRSRGPAWDASLSMEQQKDWRRHADFMNDLAADGFVVLVEPLEGTDDVLLIARAHDADEVRERLAEDCWVIDGHLLTRWVAPWTLRIGSVG